ncbi:protein kinase [Streptomyces sp. NPDC051742]|uniref:protein kinase domain-containing protein n=1 Tax=unclassified Streptomyces TaxID=2593676 RepID=UPI00341EFA71
MEALQGGDPERIANYRLIGRLGEGGMGVVYLARGPRGRMMAVKTIRPELAAMPDFRLRFRREVALAQRVGGEWTAAVIEGDPDAVLPWVATEFVPGPTLHQVVQDHGPLPELSVWALASGLSRALADVHAEELVHRDLKPSNVLVTIERPVVIDFGIARAAGSAASGLTSTGAMVGTPGFMSPEQIRGETLTQASDIFSLGAVLAFASTGRPPFAVTEGQLPALLYQMLEGRPNLAGAPAGIRGLIEDCLRKDPAERPSLAELRRRVEADARHLQAPWLPSQVLARLGRDAVHLLQRDDPHTYVPTLVPSALTTHAADAPVSAPPFAQGAARPDRPLPRPRRRPGVTAAAAFGWRTPAVYWLLSLLSLTCLASVVYYASLDFEARTYSYEGRLPEGEDLFDIDAWGDDPVFYVLLSGKILLTAALVVCWLLWFTRARAVAELRQASSTRYRAAMSVVGWFLPLANLVIPKQIADDIWCASVAGSERARPPARVHVWWALWLATLAASPLIFTPFTNLLSKKQVESGTYRYEGTFEAWLNLPAHLLVVAAGIAASLYVRDVTALQTDNPATSRLP